MLLSSKRYLTMPVELTSECPLTRHGIGHQGKEAVVFCLNFLWQNKVCGYFIASLQQKKKTTFL